MRLRFCLFVKLAIFCFFQPLFSQTSLPLNTIVTENFNGIGTSSTATLPTNWRMSPSGNAVGSWASGVNTTTQAASSGTPSTGGRYNWGNTSGTDRAVGFLTTASYNSPNAVMAYYRNETGSSVSSVTLSYALERYITNAATGSVDLYYSLDGTAWTLVSAGSTVAGDFPPGASSSTFAFPKTIHRTISISVNLSNNSDIYFRWVFNTGNVNPQGLGLDNVSVFAGPATPVLIATLKDILQTDGGTAGQFNEGDVIRYETKIKNVGTGDAQNVQINIPPPSNTTLVPGSIKTSAVAVDDHYTTSFNTALNGTSVLANDFGVPAPSSIVSFGITTDASANAPGATGVSDARGSVTMQANGTFTYTPPSGFSGVDKFAYVTGNGNLPNNDAIVFITVTPDITFNTTPVDPTCNNGSNGSITFNASGGNGTLQYSITGSAGTYQSSNVFSGLTAGTYNVAVKDAGGLIKTGTVTLNNPAAIVVSGSIPTLTYNAAMSTASFTKTGGTGAITWTATGLPTGISINSTTGAVTGTPTVTGSFNAVITATDVNSCTGTRNVSFDVAPNLSTDSYAGIVGNTQLIANGHSSPSTPHTTNSTNILTNDQSDAAITVTAVTNAATTAGGSITIGADGKFTYVPPVGATGADSYTYTGTSNGVSATGTINFSISNMVWYVNNTYGGANGASDGRSHRPFTTTTAAASASSANQVIYVHTGSGNTTGNTVLKSGQTLRGQGSALSLGALSILAGTKPTLSGTITLANNVTVDGFDMNTGTATAITSTGATSVSVTIGSITTNGAPNALSLSTATGLITITGGSQTNSTGATINISGGSINLTYGGSIAQGAAAAMVNVAGGHTGTVTFNTGTLSATNGTGLEFDNADGTYNFNGTTTLNGGDAGIDILNGSGGTFSFNSNTSITNPSGMAFNINAGTANITYSGTFTKNNNATTGISITNNTGGTITFNGTGTKTLSTGTANAINLATNTGTTINFSGNNLLLTTTTGNGFNATGGGIISVAGTGNTITSVGGIALNVVSTTIGASGLEFRSISANGGSNGIVLNNTGSNGLTVTGDGASDAANTTRGRTTAKSGGGSIVLGSGGAILNTTSNAISLTNAQNIILRNMTVQNGGGDGITATTVTSLSLDNLLITGKSFGYGIHATTTSGVSISHCDIGNNATDGSVPGLDIRNVGLDNVSGTNTVSSSLFYNAAEHIFVLKNATATAIFNVTNCTFSGAQAGDGLQVFAYGSSNVTANIQNITSSGNSAFGFDSGTETRESGTLNITINGSIFTNNSLGINVAHGSSGTNTFNITNNNIQTNVVGSVQAININRLASGTFSNFGLFTGTISGNTVGTNGVANSGSDTGSGIEVESNGSGGSTRVSITNNTIRAVATFGIYAGIVDTDVAGGTTPTLEVRIAGNSISNMEATALDAIHILTGALSTDNGSVCLDIINNNATGIRNGLRIRPSGLPQASPIVALEGWNGVMAFDTYFSGRPNTFIGGTANYTINAGTGTFVTSAGCNTPN